MQHSPDTSPSLKDLVNELKPVASQWKQLGVQFEFTEDDLKGIELSDPHGDVEGWMTTMLNRKLNKTPGFGWGDVTKALGTIGCGARAEHIQRVHCPQKSNLALLELMEENYWNVKDEFAALLEFACGKLVKAEICPENFRTYTKGMFSLACFIPNSPDVREMFNAITEKEGWNYAHFRSLKKVLNHYKITDDETQKKLCDYEQSLASFHITTRIKDWIEKKNLDVKHSNLPQVLPSHDYTKLSVKFHPYEVTDRTLQYIKQLWETIAKELLKLPDLDAVLHNITEGCLFITWLVPTSKDEIEKILLDHQKAFFVNHKIVLLLLNDESIYNEQSPLATQFESMEWPATQKKKVTPLQHKLQSVKEEFGELQPLKFSPRWQAQTDALEPMAKGAAVTDSDYAYFISYDSQTVHRYQLDVGQWKKLPPCPYKNPGLVIVNDLTAVGGDDGLNSYPTLFGWNGEEWVNGFPPMKTARSQPAVVTDGSHLVVAGGWDGSDWTKVVEVLTLQSHSWATVSPLPGCLDSISATLCDDEVYIMAWDGLTYASTLSSLICSTQPDTAAADTYKEIWRTPSPAPVEWSTLLSLCGQIACIGGQVDGKTTAAIYQLCGTEWVLIGCMSVARCMCLVTALEEGIMVVGGLVPTSYGALTDTPAVEIGHVL